MRCRSGDGSTYCSMVFGVGGVSWLDGRGVVDGVVEKDGVGCG